MFRTIFDSSGTSIRELRLFWDFGHFVFSADDGASGIGVTFGSVTPLKPLSTPFLHITSIFFSRLLWDFRDLFNFFVQRPSHFRPLCNFFPSAVVELGFSTSNFC